MRNADEQQVGIVFEDVESQTSTGDSAVSWRAGYLVGLLCLGADWNDAAEAAGFKCTWRNGCPGEMSIEFGARRVEIDLFAFAEHPERESRRLGDLLEPPQWRCA